jgi:Putative beta-lactamase-inhibitor-like, PepSY-like
MQSQSPIHYAGPGESRLASLQKIFGAGGIPLDMMAALVRHRVVAMKLLRHSVTLGILVSFTGAAGASAQEQEISCEAVPAAVRAAFERAYPKAIIRACAAEPEKSKTAFEITSMEGKTGRDVLFYPDGRLIVIKETIAFSNIPEAVRKAVHKKYPRAPITLSERIMRANATHYEFRVKQNGEPEQVVFDSRGNEVQLRGTGSTTTTGQPTQSETARAQLARSEQSSPACETSAQASAGILSLVDRITSGIISGRVPADSASSGMQELQTASERLNRADVPGACALVDSVRKRYEFAQD